jgi:hypothetical protein
LNFFCGRDSKDFLSRLVTIYETWLYHYNPETKQKSLERRQEACPTQLKKGRVKNSLEEFSPCFDFLGSNAIIRIDYFPKGQTINAEYYSSLQVKLEDIL